MRTMIQMRSILPLFTLLTQCGFLFASKEFQSGFIDISESRPGKTEGSALFYWFVPAENGNVSAPLLIWFQGGPGSSGMMGLFFELGPYYLNEKLELESRTVGNWNKEFNVLFIDQPIGTGYSYAGSEAAYTTTEVEIAQDFYVFLQKWYDLYAAYVNAPLFLTGESYGGHYIPAVATKILIENVKTNINKNRFINLAGIAIGDGLTAPCLQVEAGPRAAYEFGIIDAKTFAQAKVYANKALEACLSLNFSAAHEYRELMENTVLVASGVNAYDVRTFDNYDYMSERMKIYLNEPSTMEMLNVGTHNWGTDPQVSAYLFDDIMKSQAYKFPFLLKNIRVLLYQGQFDWKDGPFSNEIWINTLDWEHRQDYLSAERKQWLSTVDGQKIKSGWVQSYSTLTEVVINAAGHLAPMNQPERSYNMIRTFVLNEEFLTV